MLFNPVHSSFWSLTPSSHLARPVSALVGLLYVEFFIFLRPIRMSLTNQSAVSEDPCCYQHFQGFRLGYLFGISFSFTSLFRGLPPSLVCLVGSKFFFCTGALAWFLKITMDAPNQSVEEFSKNLFLARFFPSMIFLLLYLHQLFS